MRSAYAPGAVLAVEDRLGETTRRPRRWPWILILSLLLLAIAFGVFVSSYDPLAPGSTFGPGPGSTGEVTGPDGVTVSRIRYRDQFRTAFEMSVRNDGPLGITLLGVVPTDRANYAGLITVLGASLPNDPAHPFGALTQVPPLRPFSLSPGAERTLVVRLLLSNCRFNAPGGSQILGSVNVRYRVLGVTRDRPVDLTEPIEVVAPSKRDCPATSP